MGERLEYKVDDSVDAKTGESVASDFGDGGGNADGNRLVDEGTKLGATFSLFCLASQILLVPGSIIISMQ